MEESRRYENLQFGRVELDFVDDIMDQSLGLGQGVVALPIAPNEYFS